VTITTVGAGIGATAAMVVEGLGYGTVQTTPTWNFFEPNSITDKKNKVTKQSMGLAGGRLVPLASRRVVVERSATLELPFDWCQAGKFTTLLNQISSTYTAGAAGSQSALGGIYSGGARLTPAAPVYGYTHTFRNSMAARSSAWQLGIATTDAVLRQYDALGCKPTKFAFSCKAGELLECTTSWDARYLADPLIDATYPAYPNGAGQTPYTQAASSYSTAIPWDFANAQVQLGTSLANASSAAVIDGVTGFDLFVERKMKIDRQYFGNAGLKDEPITNAEVGLGGTFTSDFVNKTYFADAFYSDTPLFAIVTFSAGALSATVPALQFAMANIFLDGDSPDAKNKDVTNTAFPFVIDYDNTTEPLSIIMQTTDATV
jgi:hypothetical protein